MNRIINCNNKFIIILFDYFNLLFYSWFTSDLLWTAPELLREMDARDDRFIGSQKGDIYSCAIIITEIMSTNTPYGDINCSAKGRVAVPVLWIIAKFQHCHDFLTFMIVNDYSTTYIYALFTHIYSCYSYSKL